LHSRHGKRGVLFKYGISGGGSGSNVSERHNDGRLEGDAGTHYPNLAPKANSPLALTGASKYAYAFPNLIIYL
jgi:hypothetical protein